MKLDTFTLWYKTLAPRDQRILGIGAPLVGVILLLAVLLSLQHHLSLARDQLHQQQEDLDYMQHIAPTLVAAGPAQPIAATGHESLVGLVDRSAHESGLGKALTGSTPAGNGALRVQFENADFSLLLGWLHRLITQQGLRVEDASITGNGGAGVVNVSVQLRPGA